MAKTVEYITEDELVTRFEDFKQAAIPLHQPFDEFERIARNQPHASIAKGLPRVTDGTLAALIQEQPKRVIQQVPTGLVTGADPLINVLAGYILTNELLPNNDEMVALIQKSWAATSKSLTYGSQPGFVQVVKRGDYFGSDFTLPYAKDVFLEPGKLSDRDSCVIMMRAWFTPGQVQAIIDKESRLTANSKRRKDDDPYETGWVLDNLRKAIKQAKTAKDVQAQTPNEKGKQLDVDYIQLVTAFQVGVGNKFYTFCPDLPKGEQVCRRKVNKDPRGKIPIHYMYANVDLSNPLGRGSVEMTGGMQNLLDSEVQSYQYMRALLMNPPLEIKGNIPNTALKYSPAAQWRIGSDPQASVTPVKLETASLQQFPENYGLIKSQILNLNSSSDTSISSQAGNPGFSKTDAGVKANDAKLGISDNYMRKQFEDFFQEICETEINLYFAERNGTQELQVDEETADKVRDIDPTLVNKNNQVKINYDTETPKLRFKVNAGSSEIEDDQAQIEGLQQMLKDLQDNPYINSQFQSIGKEIVVPEIYEQLFERYKLKNLDRIIKEIPQQKDAQGNVVPPQSGINPLLDKPAIRMNYSDLPPAAQLAALGSAGIQINPQDLGQPNIEQQTTAAKTAPAQPDPTDPANHPVVKMMDQLDIKFTDLPEDSKHALLDQIGLHSDELTPVQQGLNTDKAALVGKHLMPAPVDPNAEADRLHQAEMQASSQEASASESQASREAAAQQAELAAKNQVGTK